MNADEIKSNITHFAGIMLAWAAGRYHLSSDQVSAMMSDVGYIGAAAAFVYGMYAHWNMKKVVETAKVVAAALLVVVLLQAFPAMAGDMPTKAAPSSQGFGPYPTNGCGLYYGINALGSATVVANAPVGAQTIGGDIGGTLGYACETSKAGTFYFVEALADFQNLNGSQNGLSLTGPAHLEQRIGFGGPLNQMIGALLPSLGTTTLPTLPLLPTGVIAGPSKQYIYAALNEDDVSASFGKGSSHDWLISPEVGVGMLSRLSNNVVADVWAGFKMQSQAMCLGGVTGTCPKLGTGFATGVSFKY